MEPKVFLTIDNAITNQKELLESCWVFLCQQIYFPSLHLLLIVRTKTERGRFCRKSTTATENQHCHQTFCQLRQFKAEVLVKYSFIKPQRKYFARELEAKAFLKYGQNTQFQKNPLNLQLYIFAKLTNIHNTNHSLFLLCTQKYR